VGERERENGREREREKGREGGREREVHVGYTCSLQKASQIYITYREISE
jgi:hypothetical protein